MKKLTGGRSVPRVFIGGKFLGGGDETEAAHREGKLQALLEAAGALQTETSDLIQVFLLTFSCVYVCFLFYFVHVFADVV